MDALAKGLDTIDGLRSFAYPSDQLVAPAALVSYPEELLFDQNYQRGADRITIPIVVFIGRASDRSARNEIDDYIAGDGPRSIKDAIDGHDSGGVYDVATVTRVEFDFIPHGGIDYLAATFSVDVVGSGS